MVRCHWGAARWMEASNSSWTPLFQPAFQPWLNPSLSRDSQISFHPRTLVVHCQAVPVLRSLFYILTSLVPDCLSPVIVSRLCVLSAQPLDHGPLLDRPTELSAFSQLILTSLDLVTSRLHLGSCCVTCLPILPISFVPLLSKVGRDRTAFLTVFPPLYQRRAPTITSLYF